MHTSRILQLHRIQRKLGLEIITVKKFCAGIGPCPFGSEDGTALARAAAGPNHSGEERNENYFFCVSECHDVQCPRSVNNKMIIVADAAPSRSGPTNPDNMPALAAHGSGACNAGRSSLRSREEIIPQSIVSVIDSV